VKSYQDAAEFLNRKLDRTSPELRANILDFYSDLSVLIATKKDKDDWKTVLSQLDQLKAMTPRRSWRAALHSEKPHAEPCMWCGYA
jgi:hypothetical protein